jgi:hypothetical protein
LNVMTMRKAIISTSMVLFLEEKRGREEERRR